MDVRPGYKRTEVGVIPDSWSLHPLGELGKWLSGGTPSMSIDSYWSGEFPWVSSKDMKVSRLHDSIDHITSKAVADGARLVPAGAVLIVIRGMILAHSFPVGRAERSLAFNQDIKAVIVGADVDSNFLLYWLMANAEKLRGLTTESTHGTKRLPTEMLFRELVACPPPLEQEAIADALSDADALIESLEQLLTKKRQIKKGTMQELLTGKKRLPGFSGEWEVKKLGSTATLKARIGWQGLTTAEYANSGDYYLVTGTDLMGGKIDWGNCHYVDESRYKQDQHIQLKNHDVLVTKDGTIGKIALVTRLSKPATLNSGIFVIRPIDAAFYPEFFYHLLCSRVFSEFLLQLSAGSTINHLYQKDFVKFAYKTPPTIDEQIAIATILSEMDADITALGTKLAKACLIKQGMMQDLLNGKVRLV